VPASVSLRWSLSSLSQVEGLRDGTHPLAARTCEPRPLAQARQIRPAAPVGAKDWGPGRQVVRRTTRERRRPIRRSGRDPVPDPTPTPPQNLGSRAGGLTHILPAEYSRRSRLAEVLWTECHIFRLCTGDGARMCLIAPGQDGVPRAAGVVPQAKVLGMASPLAAGLSGLAVAVFGG